ncbi:hypothetical protein J0B03_10600 [Alkalibacter rhizosphaerae]|uniref:Methyl-accepting transducer domain-containing protein n=1 Tax=Alkalibacter rhizosphaerae TaxID=2815577 RepID=A0A974XEE9_9FIRM|nr:methyl-accepting chemotaxis protein [Alkalibacter rhizosphaerae]QSX08231.1 hypothetical protein J0B03_10600 [Alkalibacter rhizosphaerae]
MSNRVFENDVLEAFHKIIEFISELVNEPITTFIAEGDEYKATFDVPELPFGTKPGDKLQDFEKDLLKSGKVFKSDLTAENIPTVDFPFKSIVIPIKDDTGNVVGGVFTAQSMRKKHELTELSQTVRSSLEQITSALSDLNIKVQEVVDTNLEVQKVVEESKVNTENTNEILSFIEDISSQTNLLGLNAAIEAARAGEYGRGFDVVAKEIRKLSSKSSDSVKEVAEVLKNIKSSILTIHKKIDQNTEVYETQAASLEEITASIQELQSTVENLHGFAEKL